MIQRVVFNLSFNRVKGLHYSLLLVVTLSLILTYYRGQINAVQVTCLFLAPCSPNPVSHVVDNFLMEN
jgi:hypothetical protein